MQKDCRKDFAYYISFDSILKKNKLDLVEKDGISAANFIKANNLVIPDAKNKLNDGKIVIFDGCFYRKEQINHLKKNLKFKRVIFSLTALLNECLERNKTRKNALNKKSVIEVYALVKEVNGEIKVNTSYRTISEIVDELTVRLNKLD